jgi:hypothetical protein
MQEDSADYRGTMAHGRSPLLLLVALAALFALPASAYAQGDPTLPVNTTPATPGAWQTAPYGVTLSGTDVEDPAPIVEWRLGALGAINQVPTGTPITISDIGVHDFQTRVVDNSGNDSGWRSEQLRIDPVDPTDTSTPATSPNAAGWYNAATSYDVSATDITSGVDHVEWQLDGGLTQSGPSGSDVPIAGDGVHTLRTRAVDAAGNVSDWIDRTVRVDTVTPTDTTSIASGWHTAAVAIGVTGSDAHSGIAEVTWRVNGGAPTTTTSFPAGFSLSTEGVNTVETRVRDAAGHQTGWKSHTVRVDTTAPTNQTPVSDGEWTTADYHVLVVAADSGGSGLAEVQWRIDGGPWDSGPSGSQANVVGTGDHTLETRGIDVAGNASVPRVDNVRIDRTAPTNTTAAAPSSPILGTQYTVPVTGTDTPSGVDRVEWRVDGGAIHSGPSGTQATVTGHGEHVLETRVLDEAGNDSTWRSEDVEIDAVTGDATPPTDTTTTAPSTWRPTAIAVTVAATDAGSGVKELQWRIDGQPIKSSLVDDPSFEIDTEGEHLLETRAIDVANNTSAWREQTFKVDLSVPSDTTAIPAGWQSTNTFTLSGTDAQSGIANLQYRIDGAPAQTGTNGQVVTVGADGEYAISTRALDVAGHATAYKHATLKVDTVDPVNTTAVPSSTWSDEPLTLPLSGTDARSGLDKMQWRVGGGEIHDGGPAIVDEDGEQVLETRAVDLAGNETSWRSDTVRIDATAPVNTTPAAPAGWRKTAYTVVVSGDDGDGSDVDVIERTINGGAVSNDENVTISGDGVHTLRTRIVDNVGHASAWREETIKIDSAAPTAAVSCDGGTDTWSRAAVTCTLSADGGLSGLSALTLSRDGAASESVAAGSAVAIGDGTHTLALAATDGAGNSGGAGATIHVDATAPTAGVTCTAGTSKHTCVAAASDATSGLAAVAYSIDGGAYQTIAPGGSFTVAKGKVTVRAVDVAGNETVSAAVTLTAPKTPGATVKVSSVPVYLAGHKDVDSLVGALNAARSANGTVSLDLRPLAVGRGRYRVVVQITSGKRRKTFDRKYKVGSTGTLPRIATSLSRATARTTVKLTVRKRVGRRWRRHASSRLVLPK